MPDIGELLKERGAFLKGCAGNVGAVRERAPLLKLIGDNYTVFEPLRDQLMQRAGVPLDAELSEPAARMLLELRKAWLVNQAEDCYTPSGAEGRRFLSGGWLEELAYLAAMEAGADEAVFSQCVGWRVKDFSGENEIDVILRKGERLAFISCKALQSRFDPANRKHRNRLMDALHEADNLGDHFGRPGDRVGVLVTSDLYDEFRDNQPRYQALMGKAAVFDVRIIPLEELRWEHLVPAIGELIANEDGQAA